MKENADILKSTMSEKGQLDTYHQFGDQRSGSGTVELPISLRGMGVRRTNELALS